MSLTRRQFTGLAASAAAAAFAGATPAFAGSERKGTFSGRQGYNVSGTVTVKKSDGKTVVKLGRDYLFDPTKNPPDIKIGFGSNEGYASGSKIHNKLTVKKGAAEFVVPSGINTDLYDEVYIYCEKFTVILAVAQLD